MLDIELYIYHLSKRTHTSKTKTTMSTASAPTRFWGIVALALNSLLQPAGKICGGTNSPALRLSPPFQIANVISLIYHSVRRSFAIDQPFREVLGVVVEQASLYHDATEPERSSYFRVFVFVFGALPAFIKAMAIQGDPVSYGLALGFFIPYVFLEFIERLAKQPTWASRAEMSAEKNSKLIAFGLMMALLALSIHITFCLETMNLALMKSMFQAKPVRTNSFITKISPLLATIGALSSNAYELIPTDMRPQLVVFILSIGSLSLVLMTFQETIRMWGRWSEVVTTILAIAVAITGTLAHLVRLSSLYIDYTASAFQRRK